MTKHASIIIVSYNTGPVLARCLDAALAQDGLREVVLVDNGNAGEVRARLAALAEREKKLRIISGHGNVGFAAGCNLGARAAEGDYILLLNPDCLLPPGALVETARALEEHPDAWLAGCRMVRPDGALQGGGKRNLLTPRIALTQALGLHRFGFLASRPRDGSCESRGRKDTNLMNECHVYPRNNESYFRDMTPGTFPPLNLPEAEEETTPSYVPAISGAFMMIGRERYLTAGGMDEGYFFHVEDLDFCRHVHALGGKIIYVPSVRAIHYRSSSEVSSLFVEKHKTAGFLRYFRKYRQELCPGPVFAAVMAGIWLRLILRAPPLLLRQVWERRKIRAAAERERRQLAVLRSLPREEDQPDLSDYAPVLLAGSTGQVGLSILRRLLGAGVKTYALYHEDIVDFRHPALHWAQGDLASGHFPSPTDAPETLIHTPAIWLLPPHLERFARMGVKRLICFSSTSIEGKSGTRNNYERDMLKKFSWAEDEIRKTCDRLGIGWTIFRPTMIYGTGLDRNVSSIARVIKRFGFFPVAAPGKGLRQPVHTDDLAQAAMKALASPASSGKIYNLTGASTLSYRDMVEEIAHAMGKKRGARTVPFLPALLDVVWFFTRAREINGEIARRMNTDLVFDCTAAKEDFGYAPRPFLSGGLADLGLAP